MNIWTFCSNMKTSSSFRWRKKHNNIASDEAHCSKMCVCRPRPPFGYVYCSRLLNKLHKILSLCKLIEQQWCRQGQRLFISGWSPDRTWCQMQTSPWLTAFCAIGKSLMFGWEDRAAAKWMLGALPGIKLMHLTAASGHHDTNTAWVVTHAQHGVFGSRKKPNRKAETPTDVSRIFILHILMRAPFLLRVMDGLWLTYGCFTDWGTRTISRSQYLGSLRFFTLYYCQTQRSDSLTLRYIITLQCLQWAAEAESS